MSNKHYDLELTAEAVGDEKMVEVKFDPYNDATDMDQVKDLLSTKWTEEHDEDMPDDVEIKITDFGDTPDGHDNENDVFDFAEAWAECNQEMEVVEAALSLDISPKDIDEAYQGEFKDDEAFAQDLAENIGAIDSDAKWPNDCIDWDKAAREIMMDYCEENGHYFRNL